MSPEVATNSGVKIVWSKRRGIHNSSLILDTSAKLAYLICSAIDEDHVFLVFIHFRHIVLLSLLFLSIERNCEVVCSNFLRGWLLLGSPGACSQHRNSVEH